MTLRRFYAPRMGFSADENSVVLDADETLHLRDVLRLRRDDELLVFDGTGREFRCAVQEIERSSSTLRVLAEVEPARPESTLDLTLAIALLKNDKFDLVVQKATELGVNRIRPITSERADVRPRTDEQPGKRVARWQRIALEAAKQSGRARIPEISSPTPFAEFVKIDPATGEIRIMFAERAGESLEKTCAGFADSPQSVIAMVGPEGGWDDAEIELARKCDWKIVTLGGRIMRAETAALATLVLLQHRYGDLV